jgi:hypothetical protein
MQLAHRCFIGGDHQRLSAERTASLTPAETIEQGARVRDLCKGWRWISRKEANMAGDNKTFDGDNTRQGVTGHHVRHVLALGVAAVVLAFILVAVVA